MTELVDRFGRAFPYLRLSVIEACNFNCKYCLPLGYKPLAGRASYLEQDETARLLSGFAALGMRKVRFTGGEPSVRNDLTALIAIAAATPGVDKVALTTNGTLLKRRMRAWRAAGLTALNVSVDSLDRQRFAEITGHDRLEELLGGIEIALSLGFASVKLNAVLLKDITDNQLPAWFDYLRDHPVTLRFIELMQTGDNLEYFRRIHVRAEVIERALCVQGWQALPRLVDAGPAREYAHPEFRGRIGIIAAYSREFCSGCNRLRVTAWGDLQLCLFGSVGIPLRPLLQHDDQYEELTAAIKSQLGLKQAGHSLHTGKTGMTQNLAAVGG